MPEETDAILSDITNEKDAPKLLQGRASGQVTPAVSDDEVDQTNRRFMLIKAVDCTRLVTSTIVLGKLSLQVVNME